MCIDLFSCLVLGFISNRRSFYSLTDKYYGWIFFSDQEEIIILPVTLSHMTDFLSECTLILINDVLDYLVKDNLTSRARAVDAELHCGIEVHFKPQVSD